MVMPTTAAAAAGKKPPDTIPGAAAVSYTQMCRETRDRVGGWERVRDRVMYEFKKSADHRPRGGLGGGGIGRTVPSVSTTSDDGEGWLYFLSTACEEMRREVA